MENNLYTQILKLKAENQKITYNKTNKYKITKHQQCAVVFTTVKQTCEMRDAQGKKQKTKLQ